MAFLVWLLLQTALTTVSAVPMATKEQRRSATDLVDVLIEDLVASFESSVPVASANGTVLLKQLLTPLTDEPFRITQKSENSTARAQEVDIVRETFLYRSPSSGGPYYPAGELGVAKDALDVAYISTDLTPQILAATIDGKKAIADAANVRSSKRGKF